jgi:hypothetical protein
MGAYRLITHEKVFILGEDFVIPTSRQEKSACISPNARDLKLSFWVEQRFSAALEAQNESAFSR